jgi:hypothetical protein
LYVVILPPKFTNMKRNIFLLAVAIFSFSTIFSVSCKKETEAIAEQSLEDRLSVDARFVTTIETATELATSLNIESLSTAQNIEEMKYIAEKINNKTATPADFARVQEIAGLSFEDMMSHLGKFNLALSDLNKAYPELANMPTDELAAVVTKAIQNNSELNNLVAHPIQTGEYFKAGCPLQDICKLAVTLTNLFAGNAICAALGISIPIIGDIVCRLVLTLGVAILNGICGALPC